MEKFYFILTNSEPNVMKFRETYGRKFDKMLTKFSVYFENTQENLEKMFA